MNTTRNLMQIYKSTARSPKDIAVTQMDIDDLIFQDEPIKPHSER